MGHATEFTDGKWVVGIDTAEGDGATGILIVSEDRVIAFVTSWHDRGKPDKVSEEDRANARLIAKAPELNETVRMLSVHLRDEPSITREAFNEIMDEVKKMFPEQEL